ncbi:MAG: zinc-ribbon domain-containing protein [Deltaproteobacteria bacterium]|nr:zinc-ribbon domain-containing protein [Deltaproteobacteria bacterium]
MIIECDKCKTKYNLDDAKVKPGETKVRCSNCQNVFTVPHPLALDESDIFGETETKTEDAFMREWAKDLGTQPPEQDKSIPPEGPPPKAFVPPTMEELFEGGEEPVQAEEPSIEEEIFPFKATPVAEISVKKKRKVSGFFLFIMLLLLFASFGIYYWSNTTEGSIPAFEFVYEKVYNLMHGKKGQELFLLYLRGAEHTVEGGTVYAIQGKVANRSQETKKFVKVKGTLFDKGGNAVATSTGFCGITITNEEIQNSSYNALKSSFGFLGFGQASPVPAQQSLPFTIILFSPPAGASQYHVEIVESGDTR